MYQIVIEVREYVIGSILLIWKSSMRWVSAKISSDSFLQIIFRWMTLINQNGPFSQIVF